MAARDPRFPDRARFMGYAARVMRGLIIDHARNRQAQKRGGKFEITTLGNAVEADLADDTELSRVEICGERWRSKLVWASGCRIWKPNCQLHPLH
jgi:DNA-directed RNA polymerase specialized sigma24 family protein